MDQTGVEGAPKIRLYKAFFDYRDEAVMTPSCIDLLQHRALRHDGLI